MTISYMSTPFKDHQEDTCIKEVGLITPCTGGPLYHGDPGISHYAICPIIGFGLWLGDLREGLRKVGCPLHSRLGHLYDWIKKSFI